MNVVLMLPLSVCIQLRVVLCFVVDLPDVVLMNVVLELPLRVCIQVSVVPWIFLNIALLNVALVLCFVGDLPHDCLSHCLFPLVGR